MKLPILMAIKEVIEPTRGDKHWTQARNIRSDSNAQASNQSPICHAPHVILSAPRCVIPGKPHTGCSHAEAESSSGPNSMSSHYSV